MGSSFVFQMSWVKIKMVEIREQPQPEKQQQQHKEEAKVELNYVSGTLSFTKRPMAVLDH